MFTNMRGGLRMDLRELEDKSYAELEQRHKIVKREIQLRLIRRLVMQGKRHYGMPNKTHGKAQKGAR